MENNFNSIRDVLMRIAETGDLKAMQEKLVEAKTLSKYAAGPLHTLCLMKWKGEQALKLEYFDKTESVKNSIATPITWALPLGPNVTLSPCDMSNLKDGDWELGRARISLEKGHPTAESVPALKEVYNEVGVTYVPIPAAHAVERAAKILSYFVKADDGVVFKTFPKTGLSYSMHKEKIIHGMGIIASGIPNPSKKMKASDIIVWAIQNVSSYYSKTRGSHTYEVQGTCDGKPAMIKLSKGPFFAYEVFELFKHLNPAYKLDVSVKKGKLHIRTAGFLPPVIPADGLFEDGKDFTYFTASQFRDKCRLTRGTDEDTACEINKSFYTCVNMSKEDVKDLRLFTDLFNPLNKALGQTNQKFDTLYFEMSSGSKADKLIALKMSLVDAEVLSNIRNKEWAIHYITYNTQLAKRCDLYGIKYTNVMPKSALHVKLHDIQYNPPKTTSSYNFVSDVTKIFGLDTTHPTAHMNVPVVKGVKGGYISTPLVHNLRAFWTNMTNVDFLDYESYYRASVCVNWARNCQVGSGHNVIDTRNQKIKMKIKGSEIFEVSTDSTSQYIMPLMGKHATTVFKQVSHKQTMEMFDTEYAGDLEVVEEEMEMQFEEERNFGMVMKEAREAGELDDGDESGSDNNEDEDVSVKSKKGNKAKAQAQPPPPVIDDYS